MKGNPDPFPFKGTPEALAAWLKKEEELTGQPQGGLPQVRAVRKPASAPFNDGLDLPELPTNPYPRNGTADERMEWLMRTGVAYQRAGTNQYDRAIDYEMLKIQLDSVARSYGELQDENRDLKLKLNHAERKAIDDMAEQIHEDVKGLIEREVTRQVAGLEKRTTETSKEISSEGAAIERLHATTVLLRGRIENLESLNPLWVKIHTRT